MDYPSLLFVNEFYTILQQKVAVLRTAFKSDLLVFPPFKHIEFRALFALRFRRAHYDTGMADGISTHWEMSKTTPCSQLYLR
jgi:hypothetical protein